MKNSQTIDTQEVAKFASLVDHWWDTEGALKTLHDINPTRLGFIMATTSLADKRVLDVGCGGGILSEAMAKQGAKVTGVDAEIGAINAAVAHAKKNRLAIEYQCVALESLRSSPFDLITCMELLEHVACPKSIFLHSATLLNPGGILLVSTLNRTVQAYAAAVLVAEYLLRLLPKQTHDYNKFIKPAELLSMARAAGFEMLAMRGLSYNPLKRSAVIQDSVAVNYMMSFIRR